MRKIIDGHLYETDGKTSLGDVSFFSPGDSNYVHESLFRTRACRYFLYGEGGPSSRYAVQRDGNTWTDGDRIVPMTLTEAKTWSKTNLADEKYEAVFGPVSEDKDRMQLNLSVSAATSDAIHKAASARGISMGQLLDEMAKGLA